MKIIITWYDKQSNKGKHTWEISSKCQKQITFTYPQGLQSNSLSNVQMIFVMVRHSSTLEQPYKFHSPVVLFLTRG